MDPRGGGGRVAAYLCRVERRAKKFPAPKIRDIKKRSQRSVSPLSRAAHGFADDFRHSLVCCPSVFEGRALGAAAKNAGFAPR